MKRILIAAMLVVAVVASSAVAFAGDTADPTRSIEGNKITVAFTAPCSDFNAIGLAEISPWGVRDVSISPAGYHKITGEGVEVIWFGPYEAGQEFTLTYTVAPLVKRSYFSGELFYYIKGEGPFNEIVTGDSVLKVKKVKDASSIRSR